MILKGKKNFQCLTALDDLDYIPLDSISDDILYRSIKESLEHIGDAYSKAVIDHICREYASQRSGKAASSVAAPVAGINKVKAINDFIRSNGRVF